METTESKVTPSPSGYMYFADISFESGVYEAYAYAGACRGGFPGVSGNPLKFPANENLKKSKYSNKTFK